MIAGEIETRLKDILTNRLGLAPPEVALDTRVDALRLDSLEAMQFTLTAEEEFDICIDDRQLSEAQTLGDVVRLIERLARGWR
ncbi:MAG TPA: phosphopantetheine-binding protein [Methylomirabilota bacterium]|nr:phosphopantetheine-binding protein [Methylomirabilota bacterium]